MKKVVILATGGTIAGRGGDGKTLNYQPGTIPGEQLLGAVPGIEKLAVLECIQVSNLNSDDLTDRHWLTLVRIIHERTQDPQVAGFVVLHGTDTLEETAYFLHLVLKTSKPVVLTGAMRPSTALAADGPRNLYAAVALARNELAEGRGVLVVFADRIYGAREVQKNSTFAVDAFYGGELGSLGYILDEQPYFYQRSLRKHTLETVFSAEGLSGLPPVTVLYFTIDADPDLLLFAAKRAKGVVVAGAGNGNYSAAWKANVAALGERRIPVVRCSRTGNGEVTPDDAFDAFDHVLCGGNLSPQKAKILLQLALTQTKDLSRIREFFTQY